MAKNRMINTRFWDDDWVVRLNPLEKLLFLYLITNPNTALTGCYELSLRRIAFDTGIDESALKNIFRRFMADGKIAYIDGWVLIRNYGEHNPFRGPDLERAKNKEVKQFPDRVLAEWLQGGNSSNIYTNTNKGLNKKLVADEKASNPDVAVVAEHYRKQVRPARVTQQAKDKIATRLQTFSVGELKQAIDNFASDTWHRKHNHHREMAWLFRSDDKMESYINLKPRQGRIKL